VILSKALRMQSTLRTLRYERGLMLDDAPTLPLLPPVTVDAAHPLMLSGVACRASTRDFDGVVTAPRAFGVLPSVLPLRLDHDDATDAGRVESLSYDSDGSLLVTARVTCPKAARRPAFSVAAIIDDFDIDERTATATVRRARLCEVSLVTQPCDPHALVLTRQQPSPFGEFYTLLAQRVDVLTKMANLMKESRPCPT
jgi:hypothetical protein